MDRAFEREIIPMARSEGLALAPWNVVAGGKFRTDEEEERRRQTGEKGRTLFDPEWERNEKEKVVSKALEKVAGEVGVKHITAGAFFLLSSLPWLMYHNTCSCHCLLVAKGNLCLPYCWRSQSRTSRGKH